MARSKTGRRIALTALFLASAVCLIVGMSIAYENTRAFGYGDSREAIERYTDEESGHLVLELFGYQVNLSHAEALLADWLYRMEESVRILFEDLGQQVKGLFG